ncbi:hypothetical protein NQZ68_021006 [Dissostichus eleginoides]|nr:hypothetical protein NQZ68_021006 [Dissostichus eleginoides]
MLLAQLVLQSLFFTDEDEMEAGGEGWRDFFSCTPYVVSFGGSHGVSVCLAGFGFFSLFMASVHPSLSAPTCPSSARPGTARRFTA